MARYAVYEHKVLGRKAVKYGFSAGGFFVPLIWSLVKAIWWLAGVLLVWALIAGAMDAILSNVGGHDVVGVVIAQFLFYHLPAGLLFGFTGNALVRAALDRKGYEKRVDVDARSPEEALAKAAPTPPPLP